MGANGSPIEQCGTIGTFFRDFQGKSSLIIYVDLNNSHWGNVQTIFAGNPANTPVCTYIYVYIYMYIHTYIYKYTYIYIFKSIYLDKENVHT